MFPRLLRVVLPLTLLVCTSTPGSTVPQASPFRVITVDGERSLPVHAAQGDIVTLDALVRVFSLTAREDTRAGVMVVSAGTDRAILTAGESTVSAGGRVISLSAPVTRAGSTWLVPVDVLRALVRGIDVRRSSRLIVVPPAVVPRVTPRFERAGAGGRVIVTIEPATLTRVTRDDATITVRLQATLLDGLPLSGAPTDLIAGARTDGPAWMLSLGPAAGAVRIDESRDGTRVTIELGGPTPAAPTTPTALPATPTQSPVDRAAGIRTVVIDPGHGGDDTGVVSSTGLLEKDVTWSVAQRVKTLLESRLGVRVVFTHDGDIAVPLDRRTATANNQKADLFLSLHANAHPSPHIRGAQVLSLDPEDYREAATAAAQPDAPAVPLPLAGGGSRVIDFVPWSLAQIPQAEASAAWARITADRLAGAGLTMHPRPVDTLPLRVLVSANMPAILVELGVLSQADDAAGLADATTLGRLAEALVAAITDVRFGVPRPTEGGRP